MVWQPANNITSQYTYSQELRYRNNPATFPFSNMKSHGTLPQNKAWVLSKLGSEEKEESEWS